MQKCLYDHYDHYVSCNKDFLNTFSLTVIDKTDSSNPIEVEQYWRHPTNQRTL